MSVDLILLDGNTRAALAACRSLGEFGLKVGVAGAAGSIAHASKHCARRLVTPSLKNEPKRFAEIIGKELITSPGALILPVTDLSLRFILATPELSGQSIIPPSEAASSVQEKQRLLEIAKRCGVRVPESIEVRRGERPHWQSFPGVLKEGVAAEIRADWVKGGARYLNSQDELFAALDNLPEGLPFLLQERIEGTGAGVFALCNEGETIVTFSHRRILEKPPSGGVSVLSEGITPDSSAIEHSKKLLRELSWSGVAMVEFKRTVSGEHVLMEINPRLWGTLQLSIFSGVDFPVLLWLWKKGELGSAAGADKLRRAANYQTGRRLRWDLGTVDHLFIRLKREGIGALAGIFLRNELHLFSGDATAHETFTWSDPLPFLSELRQYLFGSVE